jgi:vacuolar protein sorting-associated protein 13A/C
VVTNLLNQYLGQFLEGLDPDQLKISVWGGEVNLVDVKVKSHALDLLHLPVVVKYGCVKKLHLSANWRHLSSKPVKVELSGVYIVAVPSSKANINTAAEVANALTNKLTRLQGIEDLRFGETDEDGSSADSYMGKLTTKILDNVEVILKDIHIRSVDETSMALAAQRSMPVAHRCSAHALLCGVVTRISKVRMLRPPSVSPCRN